jgi:hypothetical protein
MKSLSYNQLLAYRAQDNLVDGLCHSSHEQRRSEKPLLPRGVR